MALNMTSGSVALPIIPKSEFGSLRSILSHLSPVPSSGDFMYIALPTRIISMAWAPVLEAFISTPSSPKRASPVMVWVWPAEPEVVSKAKVSAPRIASMTAG